MNRTHFRWASALWAAALFASSCLGSPEEELASTGIETRTGEILGGSTVSTDTLGTVRIQMSNAVTHGNRICSGTLLTPFWVLTAHHCVTKGKYSTGGTSVAPAMLRVTNQAGTSADVSEIVRHPTLDVALLHLITQLPQPSPLRMFRGPTSSLSGNILCQGWGANSLTPAPSGSGGGTLRSAMLPITQFPGTTAFIAGNASGLGEYVGDDGGGCFKTVNGKNELASLCTNFNGANSSQCINLTTEAFREWAQGVMGGAPSLSSPTGQERVDGQLHALYRNTDNNHIIELSSPGGGWGRTDFSVAPLNAPVAKGNITAGIRGDGNTVFYWRGTDGNIWEAFLGGSGWVFGNVSAAASVPSGRVGADPSFYVRSGTKGSLVYLNIVDAHIHEIDLTATGWVDTDISGQAGAPNGLYPVGYTRADGRSAVAYLSASKIIELSFVGNASPAPEEFVCSSTSKVWVRTDVTDGVAAPAASGPRPFTRSDGTSVIVYRSTASHIIEVEFGAIGWWPVDLTAATFGAANAATTPVPYVREDGINALLYVDTAGHLVELERGNGTSASTWTLTDLTATTGTPNATGLNGAFLRGDGKTQLMFQAAANKHIYGLQHSSSGWIRDPGNPTTGDLTPSGQ